jgi:glycosyltransferase involved in cell wall biosynthesis
MIGQADNTVKELFQASENVHLLGRRPFTSLQAYMAQCQVLVAPYKKNVEGDSSKLYDYLTLGRPIISSEILTAKRLQPHVRMASGPQFWLQALEEALAENNTAATQARQAASLQHTWDVRASSLRRWLEGLKNA